MEDNSSKNKRIGEYVILLLVITCTILILAEIATNVLDVLK